MRVAIAIGKLVRAAGRCVIWLSDAVGSHVHMRSIAMACVGIAFLCSPDVANAAQEYAVKAAFLYKFGDFVEWPSDAFPNPTSPINLCLIGDDPFGKFLDETASGEYIGNHPIIILRFKTITSNPGCHIVFAAGSSAQSASSITKIFSGTPALTIADMSDAGATINFTVQDSRVRFEVDLRSAQVHGLRLSSKLLAVASTVRQ